VLKRPIIIACIFVLLIFGILFSEAYVPFEPAQRVPSAYVVGAEDVLEINVWGYDELRKTVRVRSDGRINYAMLGEVVVSGLTTNQIRETIALELRKFIYDPQVSVEVSEFNSRRALIIGNIPSPGHKNLIGEVKLLDILIESGWNPQMSKTREALVMRQDGTTIKIDLDRILKQGDLSQNIVVEKNDTIFLPDTVKGLVILEGEASSPGEYELFEDYILVSDLLRQAGGPTNLALREKCKIVRKNGREEMLNLASILYLGDQAQNYKLYDGDKLIIPRVRKTKIYVIGESERTGIVEIDDPYPTMFKLLSLAREKYFAVLSEIKVIRDNPDNPGHPIIFNIDLKRVLYQGDISQNIKLHNRDVIFLPQSFVGSFAEFLQNVWPVITETADVVQEAEDITSGDYGSNRRTGIYIGR
jgi:polysaccharide biosynthesis/export protein